MKERAKLFRTKDAFDTENSNVQFFRAMKENALFQYRHCPEYRVILDRFGVDPQRLECYDDLEKLPFLPTLTFKHHKMFSLPGHRILIKATSSGTKGTFSEIGFETGGLLCGLRMVLKVSRLRKLFSLRPCHYIVLGYRRHKGNRTAVTKTAFGATLFAPALSRTYALKYEDGKYRVDLDGVIDSIVKHSKSRFPLRFMGFPSYAYFVMKLMEERGISVKLRPGSKLMLGGGWKQFYAEQVDKQVFYDLAKKVLGLEDTDIVEFFGAVEHPILYCDCQYHHFHVPAYSRVIIRDVSTLEPLGYGKAGLVNLMTPMVKATPILSVMTDDLGILHDGKDCPCGIRSPYLEILGRVGLTDIKTCAAGAADILEGVRL